MYNVLSYSHIDLDYNNWNVCVSSVATASLTFSQTSVLVGERGDHHQTQRWNNSNNSENLEWDCVQPHTDGLGLLGAWDPAFCHWGTQGIVHPFNM